MLTEASQNCIQVSSECSVCLLDFTLCVSVYAHKGFPELCLDVVGLQCMPVGFYTVCVRLRLQRLPRTLSRCCRNAVCVCLLDFTLCVYVYAYRGFPELYPGVVGVQCLHAPVPGRPGNILPVSAPPCWHSG